MTDEISLSESKANRRLPPLVLLLFVSIITQFPNLPVPGRFTLLLLVLITFSFVFKKWVKIFRKEILISFSIVLYIFILTLINTLWNHNNYEYKLLVVFTQLTYLLMYWLIFVCSGAFLYGLVKKKFFDVFIFSHLIYILLGVLAYVGVHFSFTNASEIVLENGRLAITENEPSVATLRLVFVIFFSFLVFTKSKIISKVLAVLSLLLLFAVQSKSTIFLLPIAFLAASIFFIYSSDAKKASKLYLFIFIFIFLFISVLIVLQTNYFQYAYHFTFVQQDGSALSRLLLAKSGVDTFINNPFGHGVVYQPFIKQALQVNVMSMGKTNNELAYLILAHDMNTMHSPKSGFITWAVAGGIPLILIYIKSLYSMLKNVNYIQISNFNKIKVMSFILFLFLYSLVSEINASFIFLFSIVYFWVKMNKGQNF
jgi:hypothetical protein